MSAAHDRGFSPTRAIVLGLAALACACVSLATGASRASAAGPEWQVELKAGATYFKPGVGGSYSIVVKNVGDSAASGVTVTDRLPSGLSLVRADLLTPVEKGMRCPNGTPVRCEFSQPIVPGQEVWVIIEAEAAAKMAEGPLFDEASVEGGGAPTVTATTQNTVAAHPSPGIAGYSLQATRTVANSGLPSRHNWGFTNVPAPFTQAGGHLTGQGGGADALTFTLELASEDLSEGAGSEQFNHAPVRDPKDIVSELPPGLLGNPTAVPRCPLDIAEAGECPASSQVGTALVYYAGGPAFVGPIVNVIPETGQSAEFVLENSVKANYILTGHVIRTAAGYALSVASNGIPTTEITKVELSFWGVPAAKVHQPERGWFCERLPEAPKEADRLQHASEGSWHCGAVWTGHPGDEPSGIAEVPFLTMPADCAVGPQQAVVKMDSWEQPGAFIEKSVTMPGATGCNQLQFEPGIGVEADTLLADAPVGLGVNLSVPQVEKPEVDSTPELRRAAVTLPLGVSISPGIVDGIQACNAVKAEGEAIEIPTGLNAKGEPLQPGELGPEGEEIGPSGEPQLAPGHCPDASKIGDAEAETPLLSEPLKGHVYLARPGCGNAARGQAPCTEADALDGNLYKLYLELGGRNALAKTGVNIKVPLKTEANPATGQLTTVAEGNPQLPFSNLKIQLNGGPRAPLDNPAACGPATTTANFEPWAMPGATPEGVFMPGLPDATPSTYYEVGGCASPPGLKPGFMAGTVIPNAGRFSSFTMNLSRNDREQFVKGLQIHTPPGLLGMLSSVPLCEEPAADQGSCPESSKIGTTRVASGAGSHPFEIEGDVYLTKSYDGAPFGLSIVTPAVAGPFNLGKVVVRARINVDPSTSALTVTTDETGPYAIPQILDGVPLRLKRITVNIDRPGFMFNPTSCRAQAITATVSGTGQALAHVSSPFAAGDCRHLAFQPRFTAQTKGRTSRKRGASLQVRLTFPKGAMGADANVAKVKVSLPKALPSYLETLKKACLDSIFDENPSKCPSGSIVGVARTKTPVLPVELRGPVYFVSHGGLEFPSLVVVLQGDGVRVDLEGETFISKKGITTSTFQTVPDVPVESFELTLPQGKNHALAANVNLCRHRKRLVMPTTFWAQNGRVLHRKTRIAVTGCGKHKHKRHRHRKHGRGHGRHAHKSAQRGRGRR